MNDLPIRDGKDVLVVNWFEITVTSPSGVRLYRNECSTDFEVNSDTIAELARCACAKWNVENNNFQKLK